MAAEPSPPSAARSREGIERRIVQLLLRGGLALSAALMLVGLVMAVKPEGVSSERTRVGDVVALVAHGQPAGIAALGVAVLLATPLMRVLALFFGFASERDFKFALVALGVALLLTAGVFLGYA